MAEDDFIYITNNQNEPCIENSILTSLGCFDGSIDKSLTTSHGVEIELNWSETGQIGVLDKSSGFWTIIILDEVRKSTMTKAEWNTLSFNVLLSHAGNDLNANRKQHS